MARGGKEFSRRGFLTASGATAAGGILCQLGLDLGPSLAHADDLGAELKTRYTRESATVCPYCGVGCGLIVSTMNREVVNVEGDPDHPISQGSLCCKGQALYEVATSDRRLTNVLYRAPRASDWKTVSWEWAVHEIADRIQKTRDDGFVEVDSEGRTVNRAERIAALGGAALDNEECYLYSKLARAMGLVYVEHQARI